MSDWFALLGALWGNTVSLLSGLLGIVATVAGLIQQNKAKKWFLGMGLASLFLSPCIAWIEEHRARVLLETVRPYVMIEELSPSQIRARILADPRNRVLPEGAYERSYGFSKTPDGELITYNYRNTSKTVPANKIHHYHKVSVIDEKGVEHSVPLTKDTSEQALYPDTYGTYAFKLPPRTIFTGSTFRHGTFIMTLTVTYAGQESDPNTYFYRIVLNGIQANMRDLKSKSSYGILSGQIDPDN